MASGVQPWTNVVVKATIEVEALNRREDGTMTGYTTTVGCAQALTSEHAVRAAFARLAELALQAGAAAAAARDDTQPV